ncbi:MAG: hypothetical protein M3Z57_00290 [Candidatus Dormibacteraeota bacterium]|nr:hypothetical protein [Candidatus Dormibacteraeota bacterium]
MIAGLLGSSTAVAGLPGSRAQAATTAATQYAAGTPGLAGVARPSASSSQSSASARPHGARSTRTRSGADATRTSGAPTASAAATTPTSLLHNFNGVSSRDSAVTNFGAEFEPPDQGLCVGNGFVLEPVNSAYRIYHTDGSTVVGPFNVNDIFNVGAAEFTSDPRCYYDASVDRWFVEILFINDASTASSVDIAVSKTGDPTKMWTQYVIDTTDNGGNGQPKNPGCPCLGDQPLLGIDHNNLYISTNEFSLLGPEFNGAQIYAIAKSDLVGGSGSAHYVHFGHLSIGGAVAASVQPALTNGSAAAEYFLNSLDPNGTFDNRLGVWAMTNTAAVASGHSPTLSSRVITSEPYGIPPKAQQKGSSSLLDAGDDRMQQTQFINGTLWGALTTAVTIPNDTAERAGAAWFAVHPTLSGSVIGNATITRQGYEVQADRYIMYPAIQADSSGLAVMVFTKTGSGIYPSAAYAVLQPTATAFGGPITAAGGSGPYDPTATRWGDYSFAVLDPGGQAFWLSTEYVPPKSSQTSDGRRNWGTRVLEVCAC